MEEHSGITVVVRVRPLNHMERERGDSADGVRCLDDRVVLAGNRQHTYDAVFGGPDQAQVFERTEMRALLDASLQGYAATVFAYGQTGSGKTYTMSGADLGAELDPSSPVGPASEGIIPRAVRHLFATLDSYTASRTGVSYAISASYLEIYNEHINDLLNTSSTNLPIRWHAAQGFFVEGLVVVDCETVSELMMVFQEGTKNRKARARAGWKEHIAQGERGKLSALGAPLPATAAHTPPLCVSLRFGPCLLLLISDGLALAQQGLVSLALYHAGASHLARARACRRTGGKWRDRGRRGWG